MMKKSYRAQQRQKLMASAWVDSDHRAKWEFIEKRLGRAMTPDELKDYVGYVDAKGKFRSPRKGWYDVPAGVELSEANGDEMPAHDRKRLVELRALDRKLSAEEKAFCEKMVSAFPSCRATLVVRACAFCGRRTSKRRLDPLDFTDDQARRWICDECYALRLSDS